MFEAQRGALAAWWRDILEYALLNLIWVGSLLTIIGGPPATAAMYQMAAHSASRDYVGFRPYFKAMRRLFLPAWGWAMLQVVVYGVMVFNLWYYADAPGSWWATMRLLWLLGMVVWTVLNLFYWPFFLRQDDRRIRNTYRNVLVMCAREPGLVLTIMLWTGIVAILSLATGILLAFGSMALVALLTTFAVHHALTHDWNENRRRI